MHKSDLEIGGLVWWDDYFERWSVPCLVTSIGEVSIGLLSLDDFGQNHAELNPKNGPPVLDHLEFCSLDRARAYLDKQHPKGAYGKLDRAIKEAKKKASFKKAA
jgi:hypothetical protein